MTAASKASGPVVAAAGLVRSFGVDRAVDTVDLTVAAGETHALVGLNGAGKTTLMKMLLGMLHPNAGTALLFGEPVGNAGSPNSSAVPAFGCSMPSSIFIR